MSTRIGKGFRLGSDGKVVSVRHKLGSVSDQIKRRKAANKPKVVSRAKARAATKGQMP